MDGWTMSIRNGRITFGDFLLLSAGLSQRVYLFKVKLFLFLQLIQKPQPERIGKYEP